MKHQANQELCFFISPQITRFIYLFILLAAVLFILTLIFA